MTIKQLDHVALEVRDLAASLAFYQDQLGWELLPRPDFGFPGAWVKLSETQSLHLIESAHQEVAQAPRGNHFALAVAAVKPFAQRAEENGIKIVKGPKQRPDGVWQLFVEDPDGYVLEFNGPME